MNTAKLEEDKMWADYWLHEVLGREEEMTRLPEPNTKAVADEVAAILALKRKHLRTPHEL